MPDWGERIVKTTAILVVAAVVVTGIVCAKNLETGYEPEGLDELDKQKGLFKTTMIRPDADFSRYSKLNPRKVMLVVRDPGPQGGEKETGSLIGSRSREVVVPESEDLAKLKEIINTTVNTELGSCTNCELTHGSGPDTLVVRVVLTDILFDETSKARSTEGEPLPILKQGTIVFDLVDGETGVIQARMGERRKCPTAKESEITEPWPNVSGWAEVAVGDLGRELERMRTTGS